MRWDDWAICIGVFSWLVGGIAFGIRQLVKLIGMFL